MVGKRWLAETCSILEKLRNGEHRHLPKSALWRQCRWHKIEESHGTLTFSEYAHAYALCARVPLHPLLVLGRKEEEGLETFSIVEISADVCWLALMVSSSLISPLTSLLISLAVTNQLIAHRHCVLLRNRLPLVSPVPPTHTTTNWHNGPLTTCYLCGDSLLGPGHLSLGVGDFLPPHMVQPCFLGQWLAFKLSECSGLNCLIFHTLCSVWLILSKQTAWAFSRLWFHSEHLPDHLRGPWMSLFKTWTGIPCL